MPARAKSVVPKTEPVVEESQTEIREKPAWVVEEVTAPVEEAVVAPPVVVPQPEIVPQMMDLESKSGVPANMGIVFAILASFVVGVVVGIAGLKLKDKITGTGMIEPAPTPEVVAVATATPIPPKREDIKVTVLNGSGKAGAASRLADELKELGYVVQRTGNAKENIEGPTKVYAKEGREDWGKLVISDLKEKHEVNEKVLSFYDDPEADVVVVIGSE